MIGPEAGEAILLIRGPADTELRTTGSGTWETTLDRTELGSKELRTKEGGTMPLFPALLLLLLGTETD